MAKPPLWDSTIRFDRLQDFTHSANAIENTLARHWAVTNIKDQIRKNALQISAVATGGTHSQPGEIIRFKRPSMKLAENCPPNIY
jgi:hypothetical protein